MKKGG
jgi:hypothetical protein